MSYFRGANNDMKEISEVEVTESVVCRLDLTWEGWWVQLLTECLSRVCVAG